MRYRKVYAKGMCILVGATRNITAFGIYSVGCICRVNIFSFGEVVNFVGAKYKKIYKEEILMKKRLLSLVLAASMLLGSVNVAFADEVSVPVDSEVVTEAQADDAIIVDDVESEAAVEADVKAAKADGNYGPNWSTTSPWEATVFGDCGGQDRIDNIGNPDWESVDPSMYIKNADGSTTYTYDVAEDGKNVSLRMGVPNDDMENGAQSQGKIAGSTEGRVMYYQKLTADDDFTLTATAHINGIANNNNQVSFGAAVLDDITPGVAQKDAPADSVNAGVRQLANGTADGVTAMEYGFVRKNKAITGFKPDANTTVSLPTAGTDVKIQLKKSGDVYTIKYGDQTYTYDGAEDGITMTDDIYVGLYVTRCIDVTFKNVNLSVVGRPVELPAWETNGNGLNGDTDKVGCEEFSGDDTNFELKLSGDVGKLSSSEDSYSYRAVQAPAGEDFTLNATITSIGITPDGTPKQAASGFMLFDEHYAKKNPPEGVIGKASNTYSNSLFIGFMTTDEASAKLVYRLRNSSAATTVVTEDLFSDSLCGVGATYNEPITLMVKKSGNVVKVKATLSDGRSVTKDIDVTNAFENNQYIGYAVARAGVVKVADNKLEVGTKKVKNLEVIQMPEKLNYYSTQPFDATGLKLLATYVDGSSEEISNSDDYSLTGFDEGTYFKTPGERIVYAGIGQVKAEIPVNVRARKVTNISVDYAPIYDTYYQGGKFNTTGLQVTAAFEDGTSKKLSSSEYVLTIGDSVVTDNTTITKDMVGKDVTVTVKYTDADITIDPNNVTDAFYVAIDPGELTSIKIYTRDFKTTYYVGQNMYEGTEEIGNIHVPGLSVYGVYTAEDGTLSYQYIAPDFYEVVDAETGKAVPTFESADVGTKTIKVQLKEDTSIFDSYTINVMEPSPISASVISYPRFTYSQGEVFNTEGLEFGILSTDNTTKTLCADAFYFKNGEEYYMIYNNDVEDADGNVIHAMDERVELTEADVLAADFYIDLTNFNSANVGTTKVTLVVNEKFGAAAINPVEWDITIVEATDYMWKATLFGASSLGVKASDPSSYITVNYADGTSATSDKDNNGVKPELMEGSKLDNINSIDVVSWDGSGKISGDQDGIAYYYTKVNAQNNFTLSADVTVNRYIFDVNNLTAEQKATYEANIAAGDTPQIALDKLRSGQEAFGLMARDIIPYAGGVDEDGNYLGGPTNHMTPFPDEAIKTSYNFTKANGDEVTYETPVDLYEAFKNQLTVKDANGKTYSISRENVETTFTSNIVIAGGCTDSTWPSDPNSSSYVKKTLMNRINIMTRVGVTDPSVGGGERVGIYSTTNSLPEPGDKYNIKLTKMNTGYMITTHNYQTGDTVTKYSFEVEDDTENVLEIQDSENIYVGFFASRYADMTVENIELHETNPATDPVITATVDEAVSPKVTVNSPYYTTSENYALRLKSNSKSGMTGGVTTITMNGKTIEKDSILGNKEKVYRIQLEPNSVNRFSVVYYPNTADNFLSYDPVILRFTVTHSNINDTKKIYVSPEGTPAGDGTRDNPINFETALGTVDFGGEIIMLDGTYVPTNKDLGKIQMPSTYSGYEGGNFKTLRAEEGAHPVIDLQKEFAGFDCDADYWYFRGFDVINSKDNEKAFGLAGKHCVVEDCAFYNNGTTGFQISRINSSDATIYDWPSYNVIKSCEAFNNCDPSKNNADGFAAKLTVGYGNVFEDCISHHNLDDGWDCYTKVNSGVIGAVVLENCISYKQGYQLVDGKDVDFNATSGGNGYKLGGEGLYVEHMLKDCLTFYNKASGVDTNNNPALIGRNVIAYDNYELNFSLYSNTASSLVDANGSSENEEGKVYKFNYDMKGLVSAGTKSIDKLSSLNFEIDFANVAANQLESENNYLKAPTYRVFLDKDDPDKQGETQSKYNTMPSKNGNGDVLDVNTFFKSVNAEDSYGTNQRYERAEDGSFIHGDFLARTEEYKHDAADIVTLPDVYGNKGGVGVSPDDVTTEATTTEVTTKAPSKGSSGAGGGGSVSQHKPKTTTTEATTSEATTSVVETTTEATTQASVLTASIKVTVGNDKINVDNKEFAMDVAPYIQANSNSTMVPLRFVAIAIAGGNVENADSSEIITWDAVAKTATITAGSNSVVFTAGSRTYTVNGNTLNISNQAVAEIVDGRMFVPFRTIGEVLGAEVSWDAATKTAMYN